MSEQAIIPLQQDEVTIDDLPFTAVLLPDGLTGGVLPQFCDALGLVTHSQAQRLRGDPVLSFALVLVQIETAGGPQVVNVILAWGLPLWLNSIRASRRSPVYRARLMILKRQAAAALARRFFSPPVSASAGFALPEAQEARPRNGAERLLAAAIERLLLLEARVVSLEQMHRPQQTKRRGRPRKYNRE